MTAYPRQTGDAEDPVAVVRLLFEGPTASEAETATTKLPRLSDASQVAIDDDGVLTVQFPDDAAPLSRQAMYQLACTVAQSAVKVSHPLPLDAKAEEGAEPASPTSGSIRVRGDGWTMTQSDYACPVVLDLDLPEQPHS
ncbi:MULTISPECIES: GerMN domain-containing protein [unclassified Streptomyces]|uniref:GerMN domain-containing protein n=1 Tax=unclassified Streptomyces TaxID=2593676 RepID=UPI00215604C6|nr:MULTISPECIES: hypothetical protein [unclassified Streptomyces]